jgi:hypothetical protein
VREITIPSVVIHSEAYNYFIVLLLSDKQNGEKLSQIIPLYILERCYANYRTPANSQTPS